MERAISFTNSRGDKLAGLLSEENVSKPVVIFAHGLGSSKDSDKYVDFEERLRDKGISVFRFDFYGHGESQGVFEDISISEGTDDVLQAIHLLKGLGFTKIGLVGTSFGGISSIMAASQTPDLKFLGLICPISIPEELSPLRSPDAQRMKHPFHLDKTNNGHAVADKIHIPVLTIHGDNDEIVPIDQSIRFTKLLKNGKLEIIEGGDHQLRDPEHYDHVLEKMTDFIMLSMN